MREFVLDRSVLDEATCEADGNKRAWRAVALYLSQIRRLAETDERVGVVFV